ncbi:glycosyltransferase family 4 protein [Chlorogloeopsis sp. ULAP02]|uniref:glycosyltransferase family 4 protein n=1 Tax=Chlorogloeopsis sp. ULAP02 TaxID=3107926 RepID=UPI0031350C73
MANSSSKSLRILYAAGPGNVIGTYKYWVNGQDDPSQVCVTYSGQFYDMCRTLNAEAYIISSFRQKEFLRDGQFTIEHRPVKFKNASGILYHLNQLWYGIGLIFSALMWKANVAVVNEGTTHWFILSILPYLGVKVIPSLHCTLWRKYIPLTSTEKLISRLNRHFFARGCTAILAASTDISKQVQECAGSQSRPIFEFLPLYRRSVFDGIASPNEQHLPFIVLFIGRIEPCKGVFDLLKIAQRFLSEGRQDIKFEICGKGSALEALRFAAKQSKVDSFFVCQGYCHQPKMREMLGRAHVVIVPTTTAFIEGFCQVVAEGILAARPVVTSSVIPALSYVSNAVVEVQPDDVEGYGDALLKLCSDRKFYEQKRQACLQVQEQFYDISKSWGTALKSVLKTVI